MVNTADEMLRFSLGSYDNGYKELYLDAVTADGYELNLTLTNKEKSKIISLLISSLYDGDLSLDYISDSLNKCRAENKNSRIESILSELDSVFQEIIDLRDE